jgi:hypothetical protein
MQHCAGFISAGCLNITVKFTLTILETEVNFICHIAELQQFNQVPSILASMVFLPIQKDCVDKKNQLDVTFCILYFSSNSCSTCFGQPFAHHQELTTA